MSFESRRPAHRPRRATAIALALGGLLGCGSDVVTPAPTGAGAGGAGEPPPAWTVDDPCWAHTPRAGELPPDATLEEGMAYRERKAADCCAAPDCRIIDYGLCVNRDRECRLTRDGQVQWETTCPTGFECWDYGGSWDDAHCGGPDIQPFHIGICADLPWPPL